MRRDALADYSQQFPTACRIATLLAHHKAGFRLTLGDDVSHKIVEQPLHARAGGSLGSAALALFQEILLA